MFEKERLIGFEYAGLNFDLYLQRHSGTMAVDMGVLPIGAASEEFLRDEEHHHRCFVFGRSIYLKRKGEGNV